MMKQWCVNQSCRDWMIFQFAIRYPRVAGDSETFTGPLPALLEPPMKVGGTPNTAITSMAPVKTTIPPSPQGSCKSTTTLLTILARSVYIIYCFVYSRDMFEIVKINVHYGHRLPSLKVLTIYFATSENLFSASLKLTTFQIASRYWEKERKFRRVNKGGMKAYVCLDVFILRLDS
jgi:hypothetical protein